MRLEDLKRRLKEHLHNADEAYAEYEREPTRRNFNNLAMECFQAVNYAISIMERLVDELNLGYALTYKEFVDKLMLGGKIDKETADKIKSLIKFRNEIAHEYYSISPEELEKMYSLIHTLKRFL